MDIKAVFFDLSGVLFDGNTPIQGAVEAVNKIRRKNYQLRFVTNTATMNTEGLITKLANMGFTVAPEELFSAPVAARQYVTSHSLKPFCLVHPNIKGDFDDIPQTPPDCVVLGDAGDDLNYTNLDFAFQMIKTGAPLIAVGKNKYFKDQGKLKLDAGAFVHALEWAGDCEAIIMGKPGKGFFLQVVASTPFPAEQCLMVGDDVLADVIAAENAGLRGCLVKTGKYCVNYEKRCERDTLILTSVADLPHRLE